MSSDQSVVLHAMGHDPVHNNLQGLQSIACITFSFLAVSAYNISMGKTTPVLLLKKKPCPDCSFCQYCSETRCSLCRSLDCPSSKKTKKKKVHVPLFRKF